jgi:hypothetical protein
MTDPRRLLEGAGTDIECNLLAADAAEMPDPAAKHRAAFALAIGTASVWPMAAATTKASKVGTSLLMKLLVIGAIGVGALGTAYYLHSRSAKPAKEAVQAAALATQTPASPAAAIAPETKPAETATPLEAIPLDRTAEAARRAPAAAAAPAPSQGASISDEIRMLDAARRAQASGDSSGAIRALDDYKRQYPRGVLSEESVLLRIEALARLGNQSAARALAQKFRVAHPDSPHLRRIDSVLAEP